MADGWLVEYDGTGMRWDWLNVVCMRWPYSVFRVNPEWILGRRYVTSTATLKGAKKRIEQEKRQTEVIVYVEGGTHLLPDLRVSEQAPK